MNSPYDIIAGGGDLPQQQQQQMIQMPIAPPEAPKQDNALLWATGVIVPITVAGLAAWAALRRKR